MLALRGSSRSPCISPRWYAKIAVFFNNVHSFASSHESRIIETFQAPWAHTMACRQAYDVRVLKMRHQVSTFWKRTRFDIPFSQHPHGRPCCCVYHISCCKGDVPSHWSMLLVFDTNGRVVHLLLFLHIYFTTRAPFFSAHPHVKCSSETRNLKIQNAALHHT